MSTEPTWLDGMHYAQREINSCAGEVQSVSNLLSAVGLEKLARRLESVYFRMYEVSTELEDATSAKLGSDLADAKANIGSMFGAMLAVADTKG